ncbi:MAG: lytic transglycosylase domain-containing protein [Sarcina sp.]
MKINGLGLGKFMTGNIDQSKKISDAENKQTFGVMMEAVLASAMANKSTNNVGDINVNINININGESIKQNTNKIDKDSVDIEVVKPNNMQGTIQELKPNGDIKKTDIERINTAIERASKKYGVDKQLIRAIIKAESNFNPKVTSHAGAQGVMQIMPFNFKMLGITNGYDIEQNINGGVKLLKQYLDKFGGNVEMALMAYNGGPGTMQKRGVISSKDLYKMPKETQNYVPKVLKFYREKV